jgi:uncharacterized protein YchJ
MQPQIEFTDLPLQALQNLSEKPANANAAREAGVHLVAAPETAAYDRTAMERLQALVLPAIEVIGKLLHDEKASPSIRLRAALAVFKMTAKSAKPNLTSTEKNKILHNSAQMPIRLAPQPGRNTMCPCGSGVKFKRCCSQFAIPAQNAQIAKTSPDSTLNTPDSLST